jgi:hypothetical protein
MTARSGLTPLSYVYDGRACFGFVVSRGRAGFEAFDSEERSLGVYGTQREAAAAIMCIKTPSALEAAR